MGSSFENVMKSNKNGRRRSKLMVCFSAELDDQYRELQMALADAMEAEERSKALRRDGESVDSTKRMKPSEPESDKIAQAIAQLMEDNKDSFWDLESPPSRILRNLSNSLSAFRRSFLILSNSSSADSVSLCSFIICSNNSLRLSAFLINISFSLTL